VSSLDFITVSGTASFQVQITLFTSKSVTISSLVYNTATLANVRNSTTDPNLNQNVFLWVVNNICQLSGTYTFSASFQCYPTPSSCSSTLLQPTTFTLSVTTNNVCPAIAISPYTSTAIINLYDINGNPRNSFQTSDSAIVAKSSVVVSPTGGPPVNYVSVSQVLINSNILPVNLYTVSNPQLVSPSVSIPLQNALLYASTSASNSLQLVLFVDFGVPGTKKRVVLQATVPQRSLGNTNFGLEQVTTENSGSALAYTGSFLVMIIYYLMMCYN